MKFPKIHIISGNPAKIEEFKAIFSLYNLGIELESEDLDLIELKTLSITEVVKYKSTQVQKILNSPYFVDDTGIYFERYNKFPGTYTKFCINTLGVEGLAKLFEENQKAFFLTAICFYSNDSSKVFYGKLKGRLSKKYINSDSKTYNDLFIPDGSSIPLSMMSMADRAKISHRAIATRRLIKYIRKELTPIF